MKYRAYLFLAIFFFACSKDKHLNSSLSIDFEACKPGRLSDKNIKKIWPGAELICGKKDFLFHKAGFTSQSKYLVEEDENRYLQITLPENKFGPVVGAQWKIPLLPKEEYIFSYKIKFDTNFDFVKGGKLPGMAGGIANSGGNIPTGYDGWSARMMFWRKGKLSFYTYLPNQSSPYGESYYFENSLNDTICISKGKWHSIKQLVKLNTPNKKDGRLQAWFDGEEVFRSDTIMFRKTADLKIDQILFNVFMGGGDQSWAPKKNETIAFDDFSINTPPKQQ